MHIVEAASRPDLRDWLRASYESYLTELVSFGAELTREPGGFWQPDYFDYWLTGPGCHALVVENAGFAFVGNREFEYRNHDGDFILSEFWIAPDARGRGLGRELAQRLFAERPGTWELSVLRKNERALRFWRSLLPDAIELDEDEARVDFVFVVR